MPAARQPGHGAGQIISGNAATGSLISARSPVHILHIGGMVCINCIFDIFLHIFLHILHIVHIFCILSIFSAYVLCRTCQWTWTWMDAATCAWACSCAGSNGDCLRTALPAAPYAPPPTVILPAPFHSIQHHPTHTDERHCHKGP